jgi:glycosyltransferase involved in cell wall biosynthesis
MHISVIICTHNPRTGSLQRTLDALRAQTLDHARWELLLIDNCSAPPVEGRFDISWHPSGQIITEEQLGLTPARLRGIHESRGEILCFVDDDNVLAPDYLEQASRIGENRRDMGCWGGEIHPEYETAPPAWFSGCEGMLVVRPLARDMWGNAYRYDDAAPCGAGLCVRRMVVDEYQRQCLLSPLRRSLDRSGTSTASGGDQDLAYTAIDMGMGIGRFKSLQMLHLIPTGRLDPDYLVRLAEGMAESQIYLQYFRCGNPASFTMKMPIGSRVQFWKDWLKAPRPRKRIHMAQRRGTRRALQRLAEMHSA